MAIIVFQHAPTEGLGRLGASLRDHGQKTDVRALWRPQGPKNPHVPQDLDDVDAVISLGGPMNVGDSGHSWMQPEIDFLRRAHERKLPIVGICLGAQLIAKALGGEVGFMDAGPEVGLRPVKTLPPGHTETVLAGIAWTSWQFHTHAQEIKSPPPGTTIFQSSDKCKVQSFRTGLRTFGFQYHFECDLPMIESWLKTDTLCSAAGISDTSAEIAHVRTNYADYARLSDRLCVNLVEYVFPVSRRIVA